MSDTSTVIDEKRALIKGLDALEENLAWKTVVLPAILKKAEEAAGKHEDEGLTAAERAEWLWAMKRLRELSGLVEETRERARKFLKEHREV